MLIISVLIRVKEEGGRSGKKQAFEARNIICRGRRKKGRVGVPVSVQ